MKPFEYLVAEELDAALEQAGPDVVLKAGGVDLVDHWKEGLAAPERVLSLHRLNELAYVREDGDGVRIGAMTTLADLGRNALLRSRYRGLAEAAEGTATPQVRERATLGGNLCQRPRCWYYRGADFPCWKKGGLFCYAVNGENAYHAVLGGGPCHIVHPSNCAPALLAMDARFVLRRSGGERQVPAREFFVLPPAGREQEHVLEPGEVLTEVHLPEAPAASATVALREKQSFDWPLALASVARMSGAWQVCLGAVAPIPWMSDEAAAVLAGAGRVTEALATEAGRAAVAAAEPMSDNGHKVQLAAVAVKRALLAAATEGTT